MTTERGQNPQDSHPEGKAPAGGEGAPPGGEPETLTKAQHDEAIAKAVQKARIDAGREAKTKTDAAIAKAIEAKDKEISELNRRLDEIENEKVKDDPGGLKALQDKRALQKEREDLKKERSALEREREEHAEEINLAKTTQSEILMWRAAQAHGVDAMTLKEKCTKFNLTSEEQINDMAETLASAKPAAGDTLHVDSSKGSGGEDKLTVEWADKASQEDYVARRRKQDPTIL
jgi:chromosome segregation ATPase